MKRWGLFDGMGALCIRTVATDEKRKAENLGDKG